VPVGYQRRDQAGRSPGAAVRPRAEPWRGPPPV